MGILPGDVCMHGGFLARGVTRVCVHVGIQPSGIRMGRLPGCVCVRPCACVCVCLRVSILPSKSLEVLGLLVTR